MFLTKKVIQLFKKAPPQLPAQFIQNTGFNTKQNTLNSSRIISSPITPEFKLPSSQVLLNDNVNFVQKHTNVLIGINSSFKIISSIVIVKGGVIDYFKSSNHQNISLLTFLERLNINLPSCYSLIESDFLLLNSEISFLIWLRIFNKDKVFEIGDTKFTVKVVLCP